MTEPTEQDWWHIARTPSGDVHVWDLYADKVAARAAEYAAADPDMEEGLRIANARGDYALAGRRMLDFPPESDWWQMPGWSSQISDGRPHPTVMAVAVVHDTLPDLDPLVLS